mgnify:CR=1 FL=1
MKKLCLTLFVYFLYTQSAFSAVVQHTYILDDNLSIATLGYEEMLGYGCNMKYLNSHDPCAYELDLFLTGYISIEADESGKITNFDENIYVSGMKDARKTGARWASRELGKDVMSLTFEIPNSTSGTISANGDYLRLNGSLDASIYNGSTLTISGDNWRCYRYEMGQCLNPMSFDLTATKVDFQPVPLPAAAWLFISGIGGCCAFRRKKK